MSDKPTTNPQQDVPSPAVPTSTANAAASSNAAEPEPLPGAPEAADLLNPVLVLAAAAERTRLAVLRELADGKWLGVADLAQKLGCKQAVMSKHLAVLRRAMMLILVAPEGGDGRVQFHQIPRAFRKKDATGRTVLDFGAVALRL